MKAAYCELWEQLCRDDEPIGDYEVSSAIRCVAELLGYHFHQADVDLQMQTSSGWVSYPGGELVSPQYERLSIHRDGSPI